MDTWEDVRPVGFWAHLTHRAALRWYPGALLGLLYQVSTMINLWAGPGAIGLKILITGLLTVVYAGFLALPPLLWWSSVRARLVGLAAYFLVTLTLFPFAGASACWTWVYVACVAGMLTFGYRIALPIIGGLGVLQLVIFAVTGSIADNWYVALITVSIGAMMFAFAQQLQSYRQLRRAQGEIARLAVIEERGRFSRDMHDVLGHTLTVVTVKSELAQRLVSIDPAKAEGEIADIERLARSALADLRAAVAGYREMSLSTELAAAQAGLAAADIEAHLPRNGEDVDPALRELFGWVLREGVTNVIRHSDSRNCWVTVTRDSLEVEDDGRGMAGVGTVGAPPLDGAALVAPARGNGLDGLTARARQAGARLLIGASERGGVRLTVRKANT